MCPEKGEKTMEEKLKRGDILYIMENDKKRMAVVVSNDKNNTYASTVIVAFAGTVLPKDTNGIVIAEVSGKNIVIHCNKIMTISKEKIIRKIGSLSADKIRQLNALLGNNFSLNAGETKSKKDIIEKLKNELKELL